VFSDPDCIAAIEAGLRGASDRFADAQYQSTYSSATLPIGLFINKLPEPLRDEVGLCRVFALKAGQRAPHQEIHRNSIQRLVSFHGMGTINCAQPGGTDRTYAPHHIASPDEAGTEDISDCWDVVPANTWHFPEARGTEKWFGIAFHSASADSIIEEYIPHANCLQTGA